MLKCLFVYYFVTYTSKFEGGNHVWVSNKALILVSDWFSCYWGSIRWEIHASVIFLNSIFLKFSFFFSFENDHNTQKARKRNQPQLPSSKI